MFKISIKIGEVYDITNQSINNIFIGKVIWESDHHIFLNNENNMYLSERKHRNRALYRAQPS